MNDIVSKLRHTYALDGTQPEHPIRQAVAEILRLREEAERMRLLAVEARKDADHYRRERDNAVVLLSDARDAMFADADVHDVRARIDVVLAVMEAANGDR